MKCLLFITLSESDRALPLAPALREAVDEFIAEGFKTGVLKDASPLEPTGEGHRVRSSGGTLKVTDGPFTEAKEVVGGYALLEVNSIEEALRFARDFMELHRVHWPEFEAECEVRPCLS